MGVEQKDGDLLISLEFRLHASKPLLIVSSFVTVHKYYLLHNAAARCRPRTAEAMEHTAWWTRPINAEEATDIGNEQKEFWWDLCFLSSHVHTSALPLVAQPSKKVFILPKLWLSWVYIVYHEKGGSDTLRYVLFSQPYHKDLQDKSSFLIVSVTTVAFCYTKAIQSVYWYFPDKAFSAFLVSWPKTQISEAFR